MAGSNEHLPVPYEVLVSQLGAAAELLERLRAEPDSPKIRAFIARVEEAQQRMFAAFAACESTNRSS
jgi:hypothetical protein